jgi:hypothetical protein
MGCGDVFQLPDGAGGSGPLPVSPEVSGVTSISILTPPDRKVYGLGETLDIAGLTINLHFSDGTTTTVTPLPGDLTSNEAPGFAGNNQPITVNHSGHSADFPIDVFPVVKSLGVTYTGYDDIEAAFSPSSPEDGSTVTIYANQDIAAAHGGNGLLVNNKTITVKGYGSSVKKITHSQDESMFTVNGTASLILEGAITLDGSTYTYNTTSWPLVNVSGNGSLTMKGRAKISGNKYEITNTTPNGDATGRGGGVYISTGSLTMHDDSEISGHMYTLTTNASNSNIQAYGGGVYISTGNLTMYNNAKISGNTYTLRDMLDGSSANVSGLGGGVYISNGDLTMQDAASISENSFNGTGLSNTGLNIYGGGVSIDNGNLVMNGTASISENSIITTGTNPGPGTTTLCGGGVYISNGRLSMNDADAAYAKISRNKILPTNPSNAYGGGIYISLSFFSSTDTFNMRGGSITENQLQSVAGEARGGGIYLHDSNGGHMGFKMSSGTIRSNRVSTSGTGNPCEGGGIFLMTGTSFTMTGGTITQNECYHSDFPAQANGGGVCVFGSGSLLYVNSPAEKDSISGNTVNNNPPDPTEINFYNFSPHFVAKTVQNLQCVDKFR